MAGAGARGGWLYFIICIFAAARRMKRGFRGESKGEGDGRRVEEEEEEDENGASGVSRRGSWKHGGRRWSFDRAVL